MNIELITADYSNLQQGQDITYLLEDYAADQMGGGKSLTTFVKQNLVKELSKIPHATTLICYVEKQPSGLLNCFEGFSTFKCQPLINIHDVMVLKEFRGLGISQLLLNKVEEIARNKNCCKITLEVLEGNEIAKNAYRKFGFEGYALDPAMGNAMFWEKPLSNGG